MDNFPKYYTRLFNGVTDAIEELEKRNYGKAQELLIRAQQDAEEMYISDEEPDTEPQPPGEPQAIR